MTTATGSFKSIAFLLGMVAAILAGCASSGIDQGKKKELHLWPALPDQPRFVFEAALRSEGNIVTETAEQRFQRTLIGAPKSNKPVVERPTGIAARDGRVYIAEPAAKTVTVLDAARNKLFRFGWREPNALKRPLSVALDDNGLVYVLDADLRRLMIFDELGLFQSSISLERGFSNPVAAAVSPDGNTIYIVDRGDLASTDHKVVALAPDGKEKFKLGPRGSDNGQFNIPLAATVMNDGTLLVADSGNGRIQAFDGEGKFKFSFGGIGAELGRFSRPRSVAADKDGNIYVSDSGFNNVQIFDATGQLLMPLGRLSRDDGPGNYALLAGIAVDEANHLYVVDHYFKKIDVFRRLSDEEGRRLTAATQ
jgi:DNA-binding beta-propeller fold protein YncE